ncbi:TPA: integrase domain-containing protein [Pseudomonas aeruginosa]|nr:integrase domain-containing protein [Pseudomonas aeruginosa]HEJ2774322.1 integrase domain-containing protein [Pseudomonas aeruginosa]
MARRRNSRSKNYGYARKIKQAIKLALIIHYGYGHFGTVKTHMERFGLFLQWIDEEFKIQDLRLITIHHLLQYVLYLKLLINEEEIAVSTAINRISSVNVVMEIVREDYKVRIDEISKALEKKRCYIRRSIPDGMDASQVHHLHKELIANGHPRSAAIVLLARSTGMRLRECILADLPRLTREAENNRINIQDGCKGGRSGAFAPRWIAVTDEILYALNYARQVSPAGSRNLLASHESYIQFIRREVNPSRPLMKIHGIKGPHELRAAFACARYKDLVGTAAPVFPSPERTAIQDRDAVRAARQIISRELGHERIEVTNSYIGSETR